MAITAMARKSVTDLTRRKARALFTILTLAIAVASVGIFAVPALLQQAMDREIASTRLADLTVSMDPLMMSGAQLRAVARLPNVAAVQPKSVFSTRIYVGARRQKAVIIAVPDYARQNTDVITVKSGSRPTGGTALTDTQNSSKSKFSGGAGARVRVIAGNGRIQTLRVTGRAQNLGGGQVVAEGGFAVFYTTPRTLAKLTGTPGYTTLALRLRDSSRGAAERTAVAVGRELRSVKGFTGFADYPEIRTPGDYPGKQMFGQVSSIMSVVTLLALLSALVLLSNTMTTLIGEQTSEIAAMKAIGATRRHIRRIYRRTALLLGALGAVVGAGLGIVVANAVVGFFGSRFYGISAGFHVDGALLAASLAVGVVAPPLAAVPAIRRASRLPLAEALNATGSAVGGQGVLDRGLRHIRFLPRTAQIGLRGAVRRKRRTVATAVQVGLAVGVVAPPLAAVPAIRRASRLPLAEALNATGSAVGGQGILDRGLRHIRFLPRTAQIGLRGAVRRKRRTVATAVQVGLAVGVVLGALSLGQVVANMTTSFFDSVRYDVWAQTYAGKPFNATAQRTIAAVPGVREAQPLLTNNARVADTTAQLFGLPERPMYAPKIVAGTWYSDAQARGGARVAVIGRALADKAHVAVGGSIRAKTAAGPVSVRVVGITASSGNGWMVLMPLRGLQSALRSPAEVNNYWISTTSRDHATIDRITTRIEDRLAAGGNASTTMERYVQKRDVIAANGALTTSVTVLGLLIVAISLVGLVNAITMGVIERTREIGMLRCVGARARDVRRIFTVEGLTVAALGWLIGVPLGWVIGHGLVSLTASLVKVDLFFVFPVANIAITLVGTVVLALLVLLAPVRRAIRLKPGEALRYV
jgi:ABC-type antimicrobial peptide transport system permease subunit